MRTKSYDVIIVGGGFAGTATAYHLARRGASVLLLEAGGLASGTAGASAGRAQLAESQRGLHLDLVLAGMARLEQLEAELEFDFEWRRLGNLMLIEQERHWWWWLDQVSHLKQQGVPADMLDQKTLQEAEPLLCARRFLGAAWCLEGHLNPFKLCRAYAAAARRHGAELQQQTPVVGIEQHQQRLTTVRTTGQRYGADTVLVTAGAWTGQLLEQSGASLPVRYTHAEAIISEPLPPLLNNHVGQADFYETIHNQARAVSVGVAQQQNGTLLIAQAVEMKADIERINSAWGTPAIARDFLALFPRLANVRIMRAWAAPSPFLPDEQPAIGWMPGFENLFVATCFHLTITTIPVFSDLIAQLVLEKAYDPAFEVFSPARFMAETGD